MLSHPYGTPFNLWLNSDDDLLVFKQAKGDTWRLWWQQNHWQLRGEGRKSQTATNLQPQPESKAFMIPCYN